MKNEYDVVIAGSGPSGAAAAKGLVNEGLSVLVLEKKRLPRYKICSGIIFKKSLDITEKYGQAVWGFMRMVAGYFNIAPGKYPGHGVIPERELERHRGIIGHHHIRRTKWDVAPWAQHIWPDAT